MFALGMLAWIYDRDMERISEQVAHVFRKKSDAVYRRNIDLVRLGYDWAAANIDFRVDVPPRAERQPMVVMNGNEAIGMGAIASGMELCAMYPITPATSVSHYLADVFETFGGVVHQAEDEIAAAGVAIGASYAGKVAFTITSGPGLALKTEFIGLAVMTEIPLVVVDLRVASMGLPTKLRSDLLAALFARPGDAPRIVVAPDHRGVLPRHGDGSAAGRKRSDVVIVLTDATLQCSAHARISTIDGKRPVTSARWKTVCGPDWDTRRVFPAASSRASWADCTRSPACRTTRQARSRTARGCTSAAR
jgi:hypothetical protein